MEVAARRTQKAPSGTSARERQLVAGFGAVSMGLGDALLVGVGFALEVGFGDGVALELGVADEVEGVGELLPPLDPVPELPSPPVLPPDPLPEVPSPVVELGEGLCDEPPVSL